MKKTLAIAALLALAALNIQAKTQKSAPVTINADDSRITYVGRTLASDGTVSFDWSGVSANIKFEGTSLKMVCKDTRGNNYINVWIDKKPVAAYDKVIKMEKELEVVLVSELKKGVHEVTIQKRTEGEQGRIELVSFTTDGQFLQADGRKARQIEAIGDSYTCGYGTENDNRNDPFRPEEENCNLTYAAIAGRYFDADVTFVSHSGQGIIRNYNSEGAGQNMVTRYTQTFDLDQETKWDANSTAIVPDIVTIYLGTNDFSCGIQPSLESWCNNYATLLREVRANYGEAVPILCISSKADQEMDRYVEEAVRRSGVANVHWTAIHTDAHNDDEDLGASWHPNYKGHRKVASCMIPYISTLTGWEMPFKTQE